VALAGQRGGGELEVVGVGLEPREVAHGLEPGEGRLRQGEVVPERIARRVRERHQDPREPHERAVGPLEGGRARRRRGETGERRGERGGALAAPPCATAPWPAAGSRRAT